ncbi:MAG: hypothetical protein IT381_29100 [Deltaproteobacteria bacterium]|nr:hypothetical protein [Deltaproteobacteria bacterium]
MSDDPSDDSIRAFNEALDSGKPLPEDASQEARDMAEMAALMRDAAHAPSAERVAAVKQRLQLRRRPSWLVRAGVASAIGAAAAMLIIVLQRPPEPTPLPTPEAKLMQLQADAIKTHDTKTAEQALDGYRRDLVRLPRFSAAEPTYAKVDDAMNRGDTATARALLLTLVETPPRAIAANDRDVLRRDALARLALIDLRDKKADAALADAERGLALGQSADMLTVSLLIVRANAHRELGHTKEEDADIDAAMTLLERMLDAILGEP